MSRFDSANIVQNFERANMQLMSLERLMDEKIHNDSYNKIHEDAFAKICGLKEDKKRPWNSRARDLIGALWFERNSFKDIMKTQDFEYSKLLKENSQLKAEIEKLRNTKGEYGKA